MGRFARSAAYRIAFTYSLALAFAIIVLGGVVYFAADASFRHQQDDAIASEMTGLMRDYESVGDAGLRREIKVREVGNATSAFDYALFDRDGRRIAGALNAPRPPLGWQDIVVMDPDEGPDPTRVLVRTLPGGERLAVAADPDALERIDDTIVALFSGAFALVVLVGIAGALVLGGYLRARLDHISGAAHAIMAGKLDRRIPIGKRGDEFDQLALALNAMLDRIAQLMENLRQVSSDVAHDLRTPLARLRNQLAETLDSGRDAVPSRVALKRAIKQSDELLSLFGAILRISEVEGGALSRTFARVDLSELLQDLSDSYAPAVSDGGRTLSCDIDPGISIRGDRELIAQAVINLLDNAQHHTPPGTHIAVDAEAVGDRVRFSVADNGPGVAIENRSRIVRRFARLDSSRATAGHGLGLNLAAAVATAHGGDLVIDDNAPGLRVTIGLPAAAV